jgi:geranylgeranyl pyrophosphate synthase
MAWNWLSAHLENNYEVTCYVMVDQNNEGAECDRRALIIDPSGRRHEYADFEFEAEGQWTSTRTFNTYPNRWTLNIPQANLKLAIRPSFEDQEFITVISKPAFWEGRVELAGTLEGHPISGLGFIERSGFVGIDNLDQFFKAVGKKTRQSIQQILPLNPTEKQARELIAAKEENHYMDGVDRVHFANTLIKPIREIIDRGGKSWRSYAAIASCDVVGGDSRKYIEWLAIPEIMHVGSLIVDDVEDRSTVRRGGPTCHCVYGEPLAINAGTACYFLWQKLLHDSEMSDPDKLRICELYFEALRAGHAGQAMDIDGLDYLMPQIVQNGDGLGLERRVLSIHRLKTAAPASALAKMGAIAGGGSDEQIAAIGRYFESVGLAFQIIDDVLNLRGFKGKLKTRGEDITSGKVTMPLAKAMDVAPLEERQWLWDTISSRPEDPQIVLEVIERLESWGAISACERQARELVESGWLSLDPLVDASIVKIMLRSFGWYILERHY